MNAKRPIIARCITVCLLLTSLCQASWPSYAAVQKGKDGGREGAVSLQTDNGSSLQAGEEAQERASASDARKETGDSNNITLASASDAAKGSNAGSESTPKESAAKANTEQGSTAQSSTESGSIPKASTAENTKTKGFAYHVELDGYALDISANEGVFPAGTTVTVEKVEKVDEVPVAQLLDTKLEKQRVAAYASFDIRFLSEGKEVEPENGAVNVSIRLADSMAEKSNTGTIPKVYHIEDKDSVEEKELDSFQDGTVAFAAEAFSNYTIALLEDSNTPPTIYGIDGKNYQVSDFSEDYVALFFGRPGCSITRGRINITEEAVEAGASIKIVLMDIDTTDPAKFDSFAEDHPEVLIAHDDSYNSYYWEIVRRTVDKGVLPAVQIYHKNEIKYEMGSPDGWELREFFSSIMNVKLVDIPVKGVYAEINKADILDRVNAIRYEACQEGLLNPASQEGEALTLDDYIPIQWSSDMEEIAAQRAAEFFICGDRARPNYKLFSTLQVNGHHSVAENGGKQFEFGHAFSYSGNLDDLDEMGLIEISYSYKGDWQSILEDEKTYIPSTWEQYGYDDLINPEHLYLGMASLTVANSTEIAMEFSNEKGLRDSGTFQTGEKTVSVAFPANLIIPSASTSSMYQWDEDKNIYYITLDIGTKLPLEINCKAEMYYWNGMDLYNSNGEWSGKNFHGYTFAETSSDNLQWESSDEKVVSLTAQGEAQAISVGEASIKASIGKNHVEYLVIVKDLNVKARSLEDIKSYLKNHPFDVKKEDTWEITPDISTETAGKLSKESSENALNALKFMRYLAGISDDVSIDEVYEEEAQAAATLLNKLGYMTHTPEKPDDVSDAFFEIAARGAHSNLGIGYATLVSDIINGWMDDGSAKNIDHVGHRIWCLYPGLWKTGFGHTGSITTMHTDYGEVAAYNYIPWPAKLMPIEYFQGPWSALVSLENYQYDASTDAVTVEMENENTGKTWKLDSSSKDTDGAYLNLTDSSRGNRRQSYTRSVTIVFQPGVDFAAGDKVHVKISGLRDRSGNDTSIDYTVTFCTLTEQSSSDANDSNGSNNSQTESGNSNSNGTNTDSGNNNTQSGNSDASGSNNSSSTNETSGNANNNQTGSGNSNSNGTNTNSGGSNTQSGSSSSASGANSNSSTSGASSNSSASGTSGSSSSSTASGSSNSSTTSGNASSSASSRTSSRSRRSSGSSSGGSSGGGGSSSGSSGSSGGGVIANTHIYSAGSSSGSGSAGGTASVSGTTAYATYAPNTPGTWLRLSDGSWTYRNTNGQNWTGWIVYDHQWFYLDGNGRMMTGWQLVNGLWYYFETVAGQNMGHMYFSRTTPDGYFVGADGKWLH